MKILYYDCFSGISGDMHLGALIDVGVDKDYLVHELSKLQLEDEYQICVEKGMKNGISGTKVDVILTHKHSDHHEHTHGHHGHDSHRTFKEIAQIINSSSLSDVVKKSSLAMFMKIAEAEAKVHGKSIDEVHFHEVGAIDAIVDMVGAAIALDYLKVDKIMASSVQLGGGFVKCAHGIIPVPAPATVEILKGVPVKSGIVSFETTTPTGAAILAANVEAFTDQTAFTTEKIGYGLGHRELEIPNVLRVYLGTIENVEKVEEQFILETNIDDMNPELYSYVEEQLFEAGALDVFKTPIIMKKGRPAIKLSILIDKDKEKKILDVIFKATTSIGIRKFKVEKTMLHREFLTVKTKYGDIHVKNAYYGGELIKYKAEYEDCKRIAIENNIPIAKVYSEVDKELGR
jgi:uncharacterized protein (TIGR00299 family) protein